MDAQRYRKLEALFQQVRDVPEPERAAAVANVSGDDAELAAELDALLAAASGAEDYFSALDERCAESVAGEGAAVLPVGTCIGAWRITRPLGAGGMAVVYEAERADGQFSMRAALKIVPVGLAANGARERFLREREILAGLDHPGLAHMVDGGVTGEGLPYFVMEYVDGVPIDQYCDQHRLIVNERLVLVRQVLDVVQYAHGNLVVHRDLKPSNILVTEEGRVKLLDFGIAKMLDPTRHAAVPTELTQAAGFPLTPAWASPEQCRGGSITTASDVYSLGVLLYVLLTGRPPYAVKTCNPARWREAICEQPAIIPSVRVRQPPENEHQLAPECAAARRGTTPERLARRLRGDLDNILLMALRKEPERRYATVEQLAADLRRHTGGRPVEASADTWRYRAGKFLRRHWMGTAATAAVALTLLTGLAGTVWQARLAEAESRRAAIESEKAREAQQFVLGLFEAADPYGERGADAVGRDVLELGVEHAERAFAREPELKAEVLGALAEVFMGLADYERALELSAQSVELSREHYQADHPALARALRRQAEALARLSRMDEAETAAVESLDMARRLYPEPHEELAQSLRIRALTLYFSRQYADAEPHLHEALVVQRTTPRSDPVVKGRILVNLGATLNNQGRYEEAETHYREALGLFKARFGEDHPEVAVVLNNMGLTLAHLGRHEDAEASVRQAVEIGTRILGENHYRVAYFQHQLGIVLRAAKKPAEAVDAHRRGLEIRRAIHGENHVRVAFSHQALGVALRDSGDLDGGAGHLLAALDINRRILGAEDPDVGQDASLLGRLERMRGNLDTAETLLAESLEILIPARGEENVWTVTTELALALCRMQQQATSDRRKRLANALERYRPFATPDSPIVSEAEQVLGEHIHSNG